MRIEEFKSGVKINHIDWNKIKKGDKITVKNSIKNENYYNGVYFNNDMALYRGKEVTISKIIYYLGKRCVYLAEDINAWTWSKDMFEGG